MLAGGLARFGFVTELLSVPVRVGYLAGIALTVIVSQLPKLFGYSVPGESFLQGVHDFVTQLMRPMRPRWRSARAAWS